ncbi:MAG: hypothetical protein WAU60_08130 [Candidatus Competibacter denitrificans]|jgi:integrating conjugative element protein (TIGR03759 family)
MRMPWLALVAVTVLAAPDPAASADPGRISATTIEHTTWGAASEQELATHWGLSVAEVQRYRQFMAVEGQYFYAHLDPVMVLGLIETDPTQRARYAESYLLAERQRIAQQTGFAQLVARVQMKRFGLEPPVDFSKLPQAANSPDYLAARTPERPAFSPVSPETVTSKGPADPQPGDTVDLLVTPACTTPCYAKLSAILQITGVKVHLYGRGFTEPDALATWLSHWPASGLDAAGRTAASARIEPRRYDPLIFDGVGLTPPVALLRRQGVVIGTL